MPVASIEEVLTEVEKRYGSLLKSQLVGVVVSDGDETIHRANNKFLSILGYSRNEFNEGKLTWSAITPLKYDRLDKVKMGELAAYAVTDIFEKEYIHKNGQSIPVIVGAELISHDPSLNISFIIDITKQKQTEREKDLVIATVGHELKTPLSVLRVQAQLLALDAASGVSSKKLLKGLKEFDEHIKRIDEILSHILIFNKPQRIHEKPHIEFNVGKTLKSVIHDINLLTERKIILQQSNQDCYISGNETEIRELFMNLISNALKYSPEPSDVHVTIACDQESVVVSVKDWGRGIKKTDHKKIFQKSFQVRQPEGNIEKTSRGLGLYLCRQIIKKHNGKIEVESSVGEGATFTCTFARVNHE